MNSPTDLSLTSQLERCAPAIVAILRGVRPDEVVEIGEALVDAGIRIIEVPLNSPQPLASIERLAARIGSRALVGAGTVLDASSVDAVATAGGRLIVAPNTELAVIARALELGVDVLPGVMTPTEAFVAIAAGARHLKLFPGGSTGPAHLHAMKEVLPAECRLWAVGGTNAASLHEWLAAGAVGIGVGSALYQRGAPVEAVRSRAVELVATWHSLQA
jgi:2-dehydro-3-deoxyphosphogalactonate aldolase